MIRENPCIRDIVVENYQPPNHVRRALSERVARGIETYGASLKIWSNRDAEKDLIEEMLDAVMYAEQCYQQTGEERFRNLVEAQLKFCDECIQLRRSKTPASFY